MPKARSASAGRLTALLIVLIIVASVVEFGIFREMGLFQLSVLPAALMVLVGMTIGAFRVPPRSGGIPLFVLLIALFAWSVVASTAQGSASPLLAGGFFCMAVWSCYMIGSHQSDTGLRFMIKVMILLCIAYFLMSFALTGFAIHRYSGLFHNANAQGRFSGIFLCFFGFLLLTMQHHLRPGYWRLLLLVLVAISLVTLLASNSRTPALSAAAALAFFFGLQALRFPWLQHKTTFAVQIGAMAVILGGAFLIADHLGALDEFLYKQEHTAGRGDITQGRLGMWQNALPQITWHGLPAGDLDRLDRLHNNYLSLAMNYGVPFSVLYFTMFVYMLSVMSLRYWRRGCEISRSGAALCVFFLAYSIAEQGAAIFVVWIVVWLFGLSGRAAVRMTPARPAVAKSGSARIGQAF